MNTNCIVVLLVVAGIASFATAYCAGGMKGVSYSILGSSGDVHRKHETWKSKLYDDLKNDISDFNDAAKNQLEKAKKQGQGKEEQKKVENCVTKQHEKHLLELSHKFETVFACINGTAQASQKRFGELNKKLTSSNLQCPALQKMAEETKTVKEKYDTTVKECYDKNRREVSSLAKQHKGSMLQCINV